MTYPTWDSLLERWWGSAPPGAVLALDELQALVAASPELPSVLQRWLDRPTGAIRHVVLCGSSQRMMGMLLDASAPLYGRAREVLHLGPLEPALLSSALGLSTPTEMASAWATWGGIPRYWELAADYDTHWQALGELVLDPMGVLHHEPQRLLLDDLRETARAASVLALVGQGCSRLSEIGARLGQPATSLTRPLARLQELGLLGRETPWGADHRSSKVSTYRISDPFVSFWYRFVEPARSRLGAGQVDGVVAGIRDAWSLHLGGVWEELARQSTSRLLIGGESWLPAQRWWGPGRDRRPMELDLVARHVTAADRVLVGEAKVTVRPEEVPRLLSALAEKAGRCPALESKSLDLRLWVLEGIPFEDARLVRGVDVLGSSG